MSLILTSAYGGRWFGGGGSWHTGERNQLFIMWGVPSSRTLRIALHGLSSVRLYRVWMCTVYERKDAGNTNYIHHVQTCFSIEVLLALSFRGQRSRGVKSSVQDRGQLFLLRKLLWYTQRLRRCKQIRRLQKSLALTVVWLNYLLNVSWKGYLYSPRMYSRRIMQILYGPKERPWRVRL